jgi:hypothetical protein
VTTIGASAFYYCESLIYNEYGDCKYLGNKSNPYCALIEVKNKKCSSYTIHEDTRIIADAFSDCVNITSIVIPDSVISINSYAFNNCNGLARVEIPDNVTTVGDYAFYGCTSLTSVVIGNSVTMIGVWAFKDCNKLADVYYKGTVSDWLGISIDSSDNSKLINATRYYYDESESVASWWHYDENGNVVHA